MCRISYFSVGFLSIFDFVILPFFHHGRFVRIANVCTVLFTFFHCVCMLQMLFVRVPPTVEFFIESAIGVSGGVGALGTPCCFPSVMLRLRLRGLSVRYIASSP